MSAMRQTGFSFVTLEKSSRSRIETVLHVVLKFQFNRFCFRRRKASSNTGVSNNIELISTSVSCEGISKEATIACARLTNLKCRSTLHRDVFALVITLHIYTHWLQAATYISITTPAGRLLHALAAPGY